MTRLSLIYGLASLLLLLSPAPALAAGDWAWPVRGEVIGHYANVGDPYAAGQHRGIDIAAPVGRAVAAPVSGRVTFAGTAGSSGLTVSLRTGDGRYDTSYLHLSSVSVGEGESVGRGERLGAIGTTGRRSAAAPHLHFGVREAGSRHAYVDPLSLLAPLAGPGGEAPGGLPAPVTAPFRARPGSLPAAAPRRALPTPARRPLGRRSPAGAPGRAPAPAVQPAGSAVARALRPEALGASPAPAHSPRGERSALAGPQAAPVRAPVPGGPGDRVVGKARDEGGVDLGYVLACLGLAAAGLALGRPAAMHAAASRGRCAVEQTLTALAGGQRRASRVFGRWRTTSLPPSTTSTRSPT